MQIASRAILRIHLSLPYPATTSIEPSLERSSICCSLPPASHFLLHILALRSSSSPIVACRRPHRSYCSHRRPSIARLGSLGFVYLSSNSLVIVALNEVRIRSVFIVMATPCLCLCFCFSFSSSHRSPCFLPFFLSFLYCPSKRREDATDGETTDSPRQGQGAIKSNRVESMAAVGWDDLLVCLPAGIIGHRFQRRSPANLGPVTSLMNPGNCWGERMILDIWYLATGSSLLDDVRNTELRHKLGAGAERKSNASSAASFRKYMHGRSVLPTTRLNTTPPRMHIPGWLSESPSSSSIFKANRCCGLSLASSVDSPSLPPPPPPPPPFLYPDIPILAAG